MGQQNARRLGLREGGYTLVSADLAAALKEVDGRTSGADLWMTVTRSAGLITKVEYFSDAARTTLVIERTVTRTVGGGGVPRITGIVTKFFNADGSEDSRVTDTVARSSDLIVTDDGPFSTGEGTEI